MKTRGWQSEAIAVTALVLLPLLFWWRLWALNPADRAAIPEGDFTSQYYPLQLFAARAVSTGRVPAWDPYINAGQPGVGDIQTGAFYPPNLVLSLFLSAAGLPFGPGALHAQVIVHFSLASLFTYLFVRRRARQAGARAAAARFAGAVAALSFTYAGYLTSFPVQQLTILETAAWLPLILLAVDLSAEWARLHGRLGSPWPPILAGLAIGCASLAGHPQTALYVVYATLAYGLFRAAEGLRPLPSGEEGEAPARGARATLRALATGRLAPYALRVLLSLALPLALGMAIAAAQLVPSLTFIARSTRAGLDYEAVAWGLPLAEITHLLYPGYFGGSPQYTGILPAILAVAACLRPGRGRREAIFWLVVGAVAFVLAFGGNTFLYTLAYLALPGFGAVRNQERILYLFSFAVSVLAGYGALSLVQPLEKPLRATFRRLVRGLGWVWVAFLVLTAAWYFGMLEGMQQGVQVNLFEGVLRHHALLLMVLGGSGLLFWMRLAGSGRRAWLNVLSLGLIGLNLFTVNGRYNLAEPTVGGPFPQTELVRFLQAQPGTFRISSAGLLPGGANAGIVYGLEDITANTPLRLESFQRLEDRVSSWRRWQLLNVHYVLSEREIDGPGLERVFEEGPVKVYRLGDPLPRAWVVHDWSVASDDQAIEFLNAGDQDLRSRAVLEVPLPPPTAEGRQEASTVRAVESGPGWLVLEATTNQAGLLVVSQPYYPGWRAQVDGQRADIYRADYCLQAIPVDAGTHRVELGYHLSLWPAAVSLGAAGLCLAGLIAGRLTCRTRLNGP